MTNSKIWMNLIYMLNMPYICDTNLINVLGWYCRLNAWKIRGVTDAYLPRLVASGSLVCFCSSLGMVASKLVKRQRSHEGEVMRKQRYGVEDQEGKNVNWGGARGGQATWAVASRSAANEVEQSGSLWRHPHAGAPLW